VGVHVADHTVHLGNRDRALHHEHRTLRSRSRQGRASPAVRRDGRPDRASTGPSRLAAPPRARPSPAGPLPLGPSPPRTQPAALSSDLVTVLAILLAQTGLFHT